VCYIAALDSRPDIILKVAIFNDTRPTNHYGCMLVMRNLLNELKLVGAEVIWTFPVSTDWRKHKRKLLNMPAVDAIVVNGEGTIHRAEERKFAMALASLADFAKRELNTPCYLINATLHRNSARTYQLISSYRAIYVRDKRSLHELQSAGLAGQYVPDMTFAGNASLSKVKASGVCVIDSAIKEDSAFLAEFAESKKLTFRSMIVARPGNAKFLRSPRPYIKNIIRWMCGEYRIPTDPDFYIEFLKQHRLVITGRYHTVTMCVKNRIPFVALESNTPKVDSLLNDIFGGSDRSTPIEDIVKIDLEEVQGFSEVELSQIDIFCEDARFAIRNMVEHIAEDVVSDRNHEYIYE